MLSIQYAFGRENIHIMHTNINVSGIMPFFNDSTVAMIP